MEELKEVKAGLHLDILNSRSIEHMISQPTFFTLWLASDKLQQNVILKIIRRKDKQQLINWIKNHPAVELGERSLTQLKEIGQKLQIPNYSRTGKEDLLRAIMEAKKKSVRKSDVIALSNIEMLEEIFKIVSEMSALMEEATIKEDYLRFPQEALRFPTEIIKEAHKWVVEIYETTFRSVKGTKSLMSNEMWARYAAWGDFGDHREVVLLNAGLQKLRKSIVTVNRPNLFKKQRVKVMLNRIRKGDKCQEQ
jgi:hypothetical protein